MPVPIQRVFYGDEFAITLYSIEHFLQSMRLTLTFNDQTLDLLEDRDGLRVDRAAEAELVVTGYHGTATGHGNFSQIMDAALDRLPPEDFSWNYTADGLSPILTPKFFARFPLPTWKITQINSGPENSQNPMSWGFTMKPKFASL